MGVTINANGLSLVHKKSSGISIATIPDVCKTPSPGGPVPIPYPNFSFSSDLKNGSKKVTGEKDMIAVRGSEFSRSTGDEPGTVGGIKSGTNMKEAKWLTYSLDVKIERKNACRLTDKMTMNHGNTVCLGGEFQYLVGAVGLDDTMQALCEIFCKVRQDGIDFKKKNPKVDFDYSKRAQEMASKYNGRLKDLIPEKRILVAVEKAKKVIIEAAEKAKRQLWELDAIKKRLMKEFAKKAGIKLGKKALAKAVVKFIPVVNVLSVAWDVYDAVSLGVEAYNMVTEAMQNFDPAKYNTYEIKPDMTKIGPDGNPEELYDYKFDRPEMTADDGTKLSKYQDKFTDDQKLLYKEKTGKDPKEISNKTCQCKSPG